MTEDYPAGPVFFAGTPPTPAGDGYTLVPSWVIRHPGLDPEAKLLYLVLKDMIDIDPEPDATDELILERSGIHRLRLPKARKALVAAGLLKDGKDKWVLWSGTKPPLGRW